mmetsp:Transcript_89365/g.248211  ORF Transcript_89365/g.248211 Transcript_89365/m.248211 type:complete len:217 (+) Transcript_89365:67-717(+)
MGLRRRCPRAPSALHARPKKKSGGKMRVLTSKRLVCRPCARNLPCPSYCGNTPCSACLLGAGALSSGILNHEQAQNLARSARSHPGDFKTKSRPSAPEGVDRALGCRPVPHPPSGEAEAQSLALSSAGLGSAALPCGAFSASSAGSPPLASAALLPLLPCCCCARARRRWHQSSRPASAPRATTAIAMPTMAPGGRKPRALLEGGAAEPAPLASSS